MKFRFIFYNIYIASTAMFLNCNLHLLFRSR